jgi:hypothetical protein
MPPWMVLPTGFAIAVLVVEDGAVELERGAWSQRQIGAVGHNEARCAVGAGAHGLVAQLAVSDTDLCRRRRHAYHFVLDRHGFADARFAHARRTPRRRQPTAMQEEKSESANSCRNRSMCPYRTGSRLLAMW